MNNIKIITPIIFCKILVGFHDSEIKTAGFQDMMSSLVVINVLDELAAYVSTEFFGNIGNLSPDYVA